jgi:uncharacterized OsmC-like protein
MRLDKRSLFQTFAISDIVEPPTRKGRAMATTARLNDLDIEAIKELVAAVRDDPAKAQTTWRANVRWESGFRTAAAVRDFTGLVSDEPAALGGTDQAPNPVEQVAAALGHCLAVGYVAALTAHDIEIRRLEVDVTGELDLRPFLGIEEGHAGFTRLTAEARIDADTDDETLRRLHEHVVATSPVGTTLSRPVAVDVELVPAGAASA